MNQQSRLPSSRLHRLMKMGRLASGVASSVVGEGIRQAVRGQRPPMRDLVLTPQNAMRISERLAEMRGAAMKIGQLLSMEDGQLLPREITDQLARLRDGAHAMTQQQLHAQLERELGPGWRDAFGDFDDQAMSAASIGQVHRAEDHGGQRLAVKIQYPGVAESIDSDVDNAMSIIRLFKLLPDGLDISGLVASAKAQLHDEADYRLEADYLGLYRRSLSGQQDFVMPEVIEALSTHRVLTMTHVPGDSIETLASERDQAERNRVVSALIELCLREFLVSGVVQTDANFANFRYDRERRRIGLVDFGAVHVIEAGRIEALRKLLRAVMQSRLEEITRAAGEAGYFEPGDPFNYRLSIADLLQTAATPASTHGSFDFASSPMPQQMSEKLIRVRSNKTFQRLPAVELLFLHRKLAGLYLLASRLRARVDVREIIERVMQEIAAPA